MPSTLRSSLRRWSPIVATITVMTTLVTCVIITKSRHIYTGGLKWPYFSDMGRDPPAYYVFCIGLSLAAVTLAITWIFNGDYQRTVLTTGGSAKIAVSPHILRSSKAAAILAVISVIALPVLSICDTSSCPSVHNAAAYAFFVLQTIAIVINTIVTFRIYKAAQLSQPTQPLSTDDAADARRVRYFASVQRTFRIQLGMFVLFFIAFLIYLPIGLAIIKPFKRLTIEECLARHLGTKFCTDDKKYNATETKLWNYENDYSANQLRAGAQLACILTLVGYTLTFKNHDYENLSTKTDSSEV